MNLLNIIVCIFVLLWGSIAQCHGEQITCGERRKREQNLIVGGQSAKAYQWPWHAIILHRSSFRNPPEFACGGSLISASFVLTAKHCTLEEGGGNTLNSRAIVVQLGVETLYVVGPSVQEHAVLWIHTVQNFCCKGLRNDIALLELRTTVHFNNFVIPVCLPEEEVMHGELGTVVGFGWTEQDEVSQTLKKIQLPVIETGKCLRSDRSGWGGSLDEGVFCAGYLNGSTVCNGDSGGGLMFQKDGTWHIGGIVAFSMERNDGAGRCRHNSYGGFTNVYTYLKWIKHVTGLKSDPRKFLITNTTARNNRPVDCDGEAPEYSMQSPLKHLSWMLFCSEKYKNMNYGLDSFRRRN